MNISIRWNKENGRFYQVYLQKDLFKDWCVICCWGSRNNRLGNSKNHVFSTKKKAIAFISGTIARRKKRGYLLVAP